MSATVDDTLSSRRGELESLVSLALDTARSRGATQAAAGASLDQGLSVTARLGEVETIEHHRDRGIGLTVWIGQRKGSASTSDFTPEAIAQTVDAALAIARHTSEDACAGLADPADLARDIPDLDLDHPWDLDAPRAVELAIACENAARDFDARITNSEGATVNTHRGLSVYGNTHGFLAGYTGTRHSLSCAVLAGEGDAMQRDYWYTVARDAAALEDHESVGRRAAERTLRRLGARRIATGSMPVLFAAELATGLAGHLVGALRGGAQYRKTTFLLNAAGEKLFPDFFHIREEPHVRGALGSAPYDHEGVATRARDLVKDGVIGGYVLDSYSARKLGLKTTGNAGGVHNLIVSHGDLDLDGLLREMGTGLYVTELMGHGVNPVTGDYSRGAVGFYVENGALVHPVEEVTIAGNLRAMFAHLRAVGADLERRGNIHTGSWLVDGMTVAGE